MRLTQKHNYINRQIAGLITLIILVTLIICYVLNACFLGDFYLLKKEKNMGELFEDINKMTSDSSTLYTEDKMDILLDFATEYSVSIFVLDESDELIISEGSSSDFLYQNYDKIVLVNDNDSVIRTTDFFIIKRCELFGQKKDAIVLSGDLSDGGKAFIVSPVKAIEYVSSIVNHFLIIVSLVGTVIALFLAMASIGRLTKPLFNMIDITKKISNFDFSVKYTQQKFYNEFDDLGEHINEMSLTLERAIDQLQRANENLKQQLEVQEEAENMRKEFISNVSHELKTPIALIQGYAEGLQEGIMDDENSRQIYLDVILDEANKMNRLVREMLILNQLEAGQMDADLCDFDLTGILDGIIESNKIYFEAQSIDFTFVNKMPLSVRADEFLVEQVFSNFMSNAIHYVMNENIIMVKYEFPKRGKVRISVFNSGNNIPKKDIKHIWEKFYKVDKARSREYGGSGIGLSVVKATMELLHEKFGVENLPNGVEFWFELSLSKEKKNKQNS